jgi:hypothetical protein
VNPAFTLALLQHLRRETALMGADRLYFRSQALKINADVGDPVKAGWGRGKIWMNW